MGTNCVPLVADLFLFCYERDFMLSLSDKNQIKVIDAFNYTSRYLDELLNIDKNFCDSMINHIYPPELQLNKANVSHTKPHFWIYIYLYRMVLLRLKFMIIEMTPLLDGDVPSSISYAICISQLIRFARVSSHVDDFNTRNNVLTAKLPKQGYRYHNPQKAFSKFYWRHITLVSKYNVGLKQFFFKTL